VDVFSAGRTNAERSIVDACERTIDQAEQGATLAAALKQRLFRQAENASIGGILRGVDVKGSSFLFEPAQKFLDLRAAGFQPLFRLFDFN
jgi:hypothetical protein